MQIIIGRSYHFHYPYYGTPDGYPEYTAHSGKIVTVLRKLGRDEAGDNPVTIRNAAGYLERHTNG